MNGTTLVTSLWAYLTQGQRVINIDPSQQPSIAIHTFVLITTLDNYNIT